MREFGDVEEVAHELRHHLSGVVAVVIGEREPLIVVEEILPHIALHARPHDVSPARDEILAAVPDDVHREQPRADVPERAEDHGGFLEKKLFGQQIQDLRERQIDRADRQRADHVKVKKPPVWVIVADEPPERL